MTQKAKQLHTTKPLKFSSFAM